MPSPYSLEGVRGILASLGDPQNTFKVIHVAGTNGKGSVCRMIESILLSARLKVGLNTSPHLVSELERIRINGACLNRTDWNQLALIVEKQASELGITLSYHEFVTILAILAFQKFNIQYVILEVGLGGRLDASNVIDIGKICCLTSISYDHCEILGATLPEILEEKLGIVNRHSSLVVGKLPLTLRESIPKKKLCNDIHIQDVDFHSCMINKGSSSCQNTVCHYQDSHSEMTYSLSLLGDHQVANSAVAIRVSKILGLSDAVIRNGLSNVKWPGRLEIRRFGEHEFLFDAAHNRAGVDSLCSFLDREGKVFDTLFFASKPDKEWQYGLSTLSRFCRKVVCYCEAPFVGEALVQEFLEVQGLEAVVVRGKLDEVVPMLLNNRQSVLVTGSIYMMGPLRDFVERFYD